MPPSFNPQRSTLNRLAARRCCRRLGQRHWRPLDRRHVRTLPGFGRGPNYLTRAIGAFRRALRAHRRLARLAPRLFDAAVVERERRQREERRRHMAIWEPVLRKAYGPVSPAEPPAERWEDRPPRLHPRTERAVAREFASWNFWFAAGRLALECQRQRRPHALLSFSQMAGLLDVGFALARLACGLDSTHTAPEPLGDHSRVEADLQRAYGWARDAPAP
jgi:hypothetical protein